MNADNPASQQHAQQQRPVFAPTAQQAQQRPAAPQQPQATSQQATFPQQRPAAQPTGTQPTNPQQRPATQPTGPQPTGPQTGAPAAPPRRSTTTFTGTQATSATAASTAASTSAEDKESAGFLSKIPFLNRGGGDDGTGTVKLSGKGGPRKVRVMIASVDPWSAMKMSFLLAIAANIMFVVAVSILWGTLDSMGLFTTVEDKIHQYFAIETQVDLLQFVEYSKVMSGAIVLGVINTVLLTAIGTIFGFLYNIVSAMVGGIYATLSDD